MNKDSTGTVAAASGQAPYADLVQRLPVTFRPFINSRLKDWDKLFPFEQDYLQRFLETLDKLNQDEFNQLFKNIRGIEARMDVQSWAFSTHDETIENAALLARSPYYEQWRYAVQDVFNKIDRQLASRPGQTNLKSDRRMILIILPADLPVDRQHPWKHWKNLGRELRADAGSSPLGRSYSDILLGGARPGSPTSGILEGLSKRTVRSPYDFWMIDAGHALGVALSGATPSATSPAATSLSYVELQKFREKFLDRQNWVRKDLADLDTVYANLRQMDVTSWSPPGIANRLAAKEFVKELFLSGNGADVMSNSFVEWGASEALRRARPSVLVARFGTRNKPKLFTSLAALENQEKASPLPDVVDLEGSAVDAAMLAPYIWLAASRYNEYKDALCLCVADAVPGIYAIAPSEHPLLQATQPIHIEQIAAILSTSVA